MNSSSPSIWVEICFCFLYKLLEILICIYEAAKHFFFNEGMIIFNTFNTTYIDDLPMIDITRSIKMYN